MPSDRVERKRARTREAIKAAAVELAAERDFRQVSLEHIADRADVARGTIYNLYEGKDALLYEIVSPLMKRIAGRARELTEGGRVSLDGLAGIFADAWVEDRGALGLMLRLRGPEMKPLDEDHRLVIGAFASAFASLAEAGRLRPESAEEATLLLFRVAVPALEALDPRGGPGRESFLEGMRGLFLASG
jgi:AcrR family transcriptional regulator